MIIDETFWAETETRLWTEASRPSADLPVVPL